MTAWRILRRCEARVAIEFVECCSRGVETTRPGCTGQRGGPSLGSAASDLNLRDARSNSGMLSRRRRVEYASPSSSSRLS